MKKRSPKPAVKQATPEELVSGLLSFVEAKFYRGFAVAFAKDRRRLLDWVILWPAQWLNERGVTVTADRYREILRGVLMEAAACRQVGRINYFPAYLAKVVQSHFDHHGDEIYEEAKNIRNLVENALLMAGKQVQRAPDLAVELVAAKRLLRVATGHARPQKRAFKEQLTLLCL